MLYRRLKIIRVVVSVAFFIGLTAAVADAYFGASPVGRWLMSDMQLVPAILTGSAVWIVLWMLVTITAGRVYCSTVCPLGTLQDGISRIGRAAAKPGRKDYRYAAPLNALRIPVSVAVGVCLLAGISIVVTITDPFTLYRRLIMAVVRPVAVGLGGIASAIIIIMAVGACSWRHGRVFCNTVCPLGGLLGLMSRSPVYRVDINTDKCIHCHKCEAVCKSECIDLSTCLVDNSRCVMCLNCTAVCPNDAITVRRGRHTLSTPMMQSVND